MAEISLNEYHDKLEALLRANQVDETIHHCRHILQYFPRSARTYRYLGRALLASGSPAEAAEVFRRLLSVYPDDSTAHTSLAAIYRQAGRHDEAIWHLERVYEQDTANLAHQQALRELYREHRGVDQPRLQLTAGAVARQHLAGGLHDEAARTLREALADAPQRVDLRLLLARALWDGGQSVEGAETALDVLEAAPDCLEANQIMARFWLGEKRPSDAQRYVGRIEALDPYAAYQVAQGGPAPDTAFTLPELDYGRIVKRRLATEAPDWLGEIDASAASALPDAPAGGGDDLPDWLASDSGASLDELFGAPGAGQAQAETGLSLEFDEDLPAFDAEALPERPHTGFTGMLAALDQPDQQAEAAPAETEAAADDLPESGELPDWLLESAPLADASPAVPAADDDWFNELAAEADKQGLPAPDVSVAAAPDPDADALAWLYGSGIELVEAGEGDAPETFAPDDAEMAYSDPGAADPLAWLYGSDIELTDEARDAADAAPPASRDNEAAFDAALPLASAAALAADDDDDDDAALDWLSDESLLDEMLDMEALAAAPAAEGGQPADDDLRVGWSGLTDMLPGAALAAAEQPDDSLVLDDKSDWQTEMPDKDQQLPDWLQPEDDEPESPEEAFSWLDAQPPSEADDAEGDDAGAAVPLDDVPEWLAAAQPGADDSQFEWLAAEPDDLNALESAADTGTPDWLAGAAQTAPLRADALDSLDDAALTEWPGQQEDEPEWLAQLAGGAEAEAEAASEPAVEAEASFDWAADEDEVPAVPAWLAGAVTPAPPPVADEVEAVETGAWAGASEGEPEWLSQLAGGAEAAFEAGAELPEPDAAFEWAEGDGEEAEAEPPMEMPDWLAAAAPLAGDAEEEPAPADIPDWLAGAAPLAAAATAFAAGDESAAAEEAEEAFDWSASELELEAQAEFAPTEELEPVDTAKLGELPEAEEIQPWEEGAAEAVPLAERGLDDWAAEEEVSAAETVGWPEETAAPAAALVDPEPDYIFEPARSEFGWLEDIDEAGAAPSASVEEALFAGEQPAPAEVSADLEDDWLSAEAEVEAVEADLFAADAGLAPAEVSAGLEDDWLSAEAEGEAEALEEALFADDAGLAPAEVSAGLDDDWLSAEADDDAELERMYAAAHRPPPADNAPEWLNNMVPGLELDYEAEEDAPLESAFVRQPGAATEAASADFNWLNRIVDEETGPVLAVSAAAAAGAVAAGPRQPRFVFTRLPAWLRNDTPHPDAEPVDSDDAASGDDDFELPDWLR